MCKFKPFNKHVLVKKIAAVKNRDLSPVLIPEDAQVGEQERFSLVKFICAAADCDQFLKDLNPGQAPWTVQRGSMDDVFTASVQNSGRATLVVEESMIEEIKIKDKKYQIVHQNYIVGILDE
tara:strand:+ start:1724 stop:2089 length:366 start_codon:yes stop_codon:yes gene_type:complete